MSSGTYIRTLFKDIAEFIGTHGTLVSLVREAVGEIKIKNCLIKKDWPVNREIKSDQTYLKIDDVLKLNYLRLTIEEEKLYLNGRRLEMNRTRIVTHCDVIHSSNLLWVTAQDQTILGMGEIQQNELRAIFNFSNSK